MTGALRRRLTLACVTVSAALAGGTAVPGGTVAAAEVRPPGSSAALGNERLSDEQLLTRYGHALTRAPVLELPDAQARAVGRLRLFSEDGPDDVYIVLRSRVDAANQTWLRVRVAQRPRPVTGWVPRQAIGDFYVVRTLLRVSRHLRRADLYRDGRLVWSSPIAIGKRSTPTPRGRFWVRTRLRALRGGTVYGPWAFGTSAYSVLSDWPGGGVIGIHGTNEPQLIPGRVSHGCVRVPNHRIRELARLMPIGTPVQIT